MIIKKLGFTAAITAAVMLASISVCASALSDNAQTMNLAATVSGGDVSGGDVSGGDSGKPADPVNTSNPGVITPNQGTNTPSGKPGIDIPIISNSFSAIEEYLRDDSIKYIEYKQKDKDKGENKEPVSSEEQKHIFESIKDTDKRFEFSFFTDSEELTYKWSFLGSHIANADRYVDFRIVVDAKNKKVLDAVKDNVEKLDLHFEHTGDLPGAADVTVLVKGKLEADMLKLYYYNPNTGELELQAEKLPVSNGYVTFTITHCSDYVLTGKELDDDDDDVDIVHNESGKAASPKTGENNAVPFAGVLAVVCSIAVVVSGRKYFMSKQ